MAEKSLLDSLSARVKPPSHGSKSVATKISGLMMPIERRNEVKQMNQAMNQYRENKETKMFIKRRAKLIRSHWRNGITGIENASDVAATCSDADKVIAHTDKKTLDSYFYRSENRKDSK